ncbi:MAG: dipeptide/oligopeptide/nickel ABC transporter ATP-binding protein [Treponema sp.]|jgi:ABC-type dipeptide/oligopeptide/nickel transport system ATPase subunit|nr:dipeptide/oligopeptide/nickel ABC transporter ATP-binding protein [Treponema sp.]
MLSVQDLRKCYANGTWALQGVTFKLERGNCLGLVGVSGCGKSTLARIICGLEGFQSGEISLEGIRYRGLRRQDPRILRRQVQMVFQDTSGSLDPRCKVWQTLEEPLTNYERLSRAAVRSRVEGLLAQVGLGTDLAGSYPHELSGGQRQRVVIARALAVEPAYLICDEPVSSLDRETREQILSLLLKLQKPGDSTARGILFITHDIALAFRMSTHILVMRDGTILEDLHGGASCARDPYTRGLFAALPYPETGGLC